MAAVASSSSSKDPKKYDVFISFSGEDVRYTFLTHLFNALSSKQIHTFTDENLQRGEEISPALLNVIKDSYVCIVIFSKTYPYSTWCLDELAQILECYKSMNQIVIPVFYHVHPSDVQNLRGDFDDAFVQHRQRFEHCLDKVEIWSRALVEISCLSGFVSSILKFESDFIGEIVDSVSMKLSQLHPSDSKSDGLFGINSRVQQVEKLLWIELTNCVRTVGIWGMGGIGKTTTADVVYNKIKDNFDAHYFAANVREKLEKGAPKDLRDEIFRQLLGDRNLQIGTSHSLEISIKRRLRSKKVLIVLDDVNDSKQLKLLLGDNSDLFCPGSRIIVTSRDSKVFKTIGREVHIYAIEGLNYREALTLFSWHAFGQDHPKQEYMNLSKRVVQYTQGIPLALVVLGSNLYERGIAEWEDELEKVKSIPDIVVQKILRVSYDGLDRDEQKIFLDIACCFKGMNENKLKEILKCFGFHAEIGIKRLFEKSLITKVTQKYSLYHDGLDITMHDLIEQMGREIVVEESNKMVEEQSRLWITKDIIHVLRNNLGTAKVEGISLNMRENDDEVEISCKAFMQMHNLRFLRIISYGSNLFWETYASKLIFPNGLEFLPDKLRSLDWPGYPCKYLPSKFFPHNLVELHMPYSNLVELGNLDKSLKSLKRIDLSFSEYLIRIPDFSAAENLCCLNLEGCSSLEEICWSVKAASEGTELNLRGCKSLRRLLEIPHNIKELDPNRQLPVEIWSVTDSQGFDLEGCLRLASLPDSICDLKSLEAFDVSDCGNLHQLPKKFGNLQNLRLLEAANSGIQELPNSFSDLKSLVTLNVSNCVNLHQLPKKFGNLQNLWRLNAAKSGIQELPDSINQLHKLRDLNCSGCEGLKLPPLNGLLKLQNINLRGCYMAEFPKGLCSLTSLLWIDLSGNNFKSIPASFNKLAELKKLSLNDCKRLEILPGLPSSLEILEASNCIFLESVSTAVLPAFELRLSNCINLKQEECTRIVDHVLSTHLSNDQRKCHLWLVGSEVPERMMYINDSGSSLSITLDPNDRLIGYSLCAVLAPTVDPVQCSAILTDLSGHSYEIHHYYNCFLILTPHSDSLFLWYENTPHNIGAISKASFRFNNEALKCGIHPIFKGSRENKKKRGRQDHSEEEEEDYSSMEYNLDLNLSL